MLIIFCAIFSYLLNESKKSADGILIDESRPTTNKTRVIADSQHVVRIDKESKEYLNSKMEGKIFDYIKKNINDLDGIILQDYNKGVLTESLITKIVNEANAELDKGSPNSTKLQSLFITIGTTIQTLANNKTRKAIESLDMKLKNNEEVNVELMLKYHNLKEENMF